MFHGTTDTGNALDPCREEMDAYIQYGSYTDYVCQDHSVIKRYQMLTRQNSHNPHLRRRGLYPLTVSSIPYVRLYTACQQVTIRL